MANANTKNTKPEKKGGAAGFFAKIGNFFKRMGKGIARSFKEMWAELKKVTWPTKQELINYTCVVLAFMAVFVVIIGVQDWISAWLVQLITLRG